MRQLNVVYGNSQQEILMMFQELLILNNKMKYTIDTLVISLKLLKKILKLRRVD